MREIKFRVWDKKDKLWVAGFSIGQSGTQSELGDKVFMQYTGLHDKHGVEIYEGDIVQTGFSPIVKMKVEWTDWKAAFYPFWNDRKPIQYQIIGNIYETPELLTK
jgi:hypothetical protein